MIYKDIIIKKLSLQVVIFNVVLMCILKYMRLYTYLIVKNSLEDFKKCFFEITLYKDIKYELL